MCLSVCMSFDLFYMCLSISSLPSFESKPIGCSSTVVAMPLAKPATKKTINAMKAMKVAMTGSKAMKGMKAPESIGKPMKPKKEKNPKGLAMKKGSRPVDGLMPDHVLHHLAIKCANPTCKSWVWLRRTDQLTCCQECNKPWSQSYAIHGCHMRQ